VAVAVPGQRNTSLAYHFPQERQVTLSILMVSKEGVNELAGGVIDGAHQDELRPTGFQPVVIAAVHLKHHPFFGHPLPPRTVPPRAATLRTAKPSRCQDA
jgi:hypothetical protein